MGTTPEAVNSPADCHPALGSDRTDAQKGAMLAWMQAIAPYGIFTTDTELRIRSWNQWLVTHSGQTAEALLGRRLIDVFPDVGTRRLDEHFNRALEGESSVLSTALHRFLLPLRTTVRGGDGVHMLQTVRIAPLTYGDQIVGTIATIEDVTQRESQALVLRRQQEHDRLLSATLALLLSSENPLEAAAQLFPQIASPLRLEVYFNYLLAPDGSELRLHAAGGVTPEVRKSRSVLKLGESPCGTMAVTRRPLYIAQVQERSDDSAQPIRTMGLRSYAGFPLMIGDRVLGTLSFGTYERDTIAADELEFLQTIAQYLALAIDRALREIALRQVQESLSEHAEDLETKIAERTAKLNETIVQLESFSYTIAHDLRAPIRSLKGYSEILLSDYQGVLPEDGQAMLRRLYRASNRLDALTRDLLAFSKIARQDVQLTPVDVDEMVQEIISIVPGLATSTSVRGPLGRVMAQRTLLQQCISNLFDNALKFIRPDVALRIVVRAELCKPDAKAIPLPTGPAAFIPSTLPQEDDRVGPGSTLGNSNGTSDSSTPRVRLIIDDNGIGIPPEAHEKIFGIFERVSGSDAIEGTGIGLAIVARAMQQMGGSCGVISTPGTGSSFWLELAAAP